MLVDLVILPSLPIVSSLGIVVEQKPLLVLSAKDCASSAGVRAKGSCYVSRRERCS
jgi:hypothetical protein